MTRWATACALAICILGANAHADDIREALPPAIMTAEYESECCDNRWWRDVSYDWQRNPMIKVGDVFSFHPRLDVFFDYQQVFDDEYVSEGGRQGQQEDGLSINRFRLGFDGNIGEYTKYRFTYELANQGDITGFGQGAAGVRDLYFDFRRLQERWGAAFPSIRIGAFLEPWGLEAIRPHGRLQFMTRAVTDMFRPGRSEGIAFRGDFCDYRFSYKVGIFVNTQVAWNFPSDPFGTINAGRDGWNVVGRMMWCPTGNNCSFTAHFGASYVHAWGMSASRLRSRPENRAADHLIDTDFSTNALGVPLLRSTRGVDILGGEVMLLKRNLMFQAEGMAAYVDSPAGDYPVFGGMYAYTAYVITGEHYKRKGSDLQRVQPRSVLDFRGQQSGRGAVEIAARYSFGSLNSGKIRGGTMHNVTLGLNWYWNPTLRWQFNWVHSIVNDGIANAPVDILQARFDVDF